MKLYHGSNKINLKNLWIGDDEKQGFGVYLTDSKEQAEYFGKYGSVYTVELENAIILDYSNEDLMKDIFSPWLNNSLILQELEHLANGSGNFLKILNLIDEKDKLKEMLQKYNVHKIKSLGFRGHYNYIVKDPSIINIIKENILSK